MPTLPSLASAAPQDATAQSHATNKSKRHAPKQMVLACIDGSNVTASVCDYAAWYAQHLALSLHLLHVIVLAKTIRHDLSGTIGMDSRQHLLHDLALIDQQSARLANQHGEALLQDAKSHILANAPTASVHLHLRHSKLLPAIQHYLAASQVVILGRRGSDHQNNSLHIGSQIETIVRAVACPIMVVSADFAPPKSYLLAFDNSPSAQRAVAILCASDLAKTLQGYMVMVGQKATPHETALYKAQQQMQTAGLTVSAQVIAAKHANNGVVAALTAFRHQHNISMIVMGAYGHSKLRQWFVGSTTTKLLTHTTAPVLLLR